MLTSSAANPYLMTFSGTTPTAAPQNCFTTTCTTPKNVAEYGIKEWLSRVDDELPGARVAICFDTAPYDSAGLPRWTCTNSGTMLVVKLGWTRASTNRTNTGDAAFERATASDGRPSVIMPVVPGAGV
ncbi:MAG: hypothetical protein EOO54_21180 [Haliea sp.]|nr:MAG: hypothetical protein EOO54_21180 [Haliea sp.]